MRLAGEGTSQLLVSIIQIASQFIQAGIVANAAVNQAKQTVGLTRYLTAQEINEVAIGLNARFPQVSVEDWVFNIQLTPPLPSGNLPPDTRPPDAIPTSQNTYLYIALVLLAFAMIRR